jgi:IS30 family transposase
MKPYQKKYKPKQGRANTPWTEVERDAIHDLQGTGATIRQIAEALDRSPGAITSQIYLMKRRKEAQPWWRRALAWFLE